MLKKEIVEERDNLDKQLNNLNGSIDGSLKATERTFNFCTFALEHFNNTNDLKKKRAIFSTIGSNLILKDKKLIIDKLHPYLLIENELRSQKEILGGIEPKKHVGIKQQNAIFVASVPNLLRTWEDVRIQILKKYTP